MEQSTTKDPWQPIESGLPPLELPVWIYDPSLGQPIVGGRDEDGDGWYWGSTYGNFYYDKGAGKWIGELELDDYKPTHWMLLPPPPGDPAWEMGEDGLAFREARTLAMSIWRSEYQREAPNWKPLETTAGIISQIDNMYAGVRGQRDQAICERNQLRIKVAQLEAREKALVEGTVSFIAEIEPVLTAYDNAYEPHEMLPTDPQPDGAFIALATIKQLIQGGQ